MRNTFCIVFLVMAFALAACAVLSWRSRKGIGRSVALVVAALIPPVIGNMIIISSADRAASTLGCYIYFLGMDLVMLALSRFTLRYCHIARGRRAYLGVVYALLAVDAAQLLLNPLFSHAFATEEIQVDGYAYYRLVPYLGQTFHRAVDYGILATIIVIFLYKLFVTPRIYAERYSVILIAIVAGSVWETYYIFSRTPVDRSMMGFGVFGLLVFYFSIFYRPMRLLDRMLANIASQTPNALFFFDAHDHCVWANQTGQALIGIDGTDFEAAGSRLRSMFDLGDDRLESALYRDIDAHGERRHYVLEQHALPDDDGRVMGSFLSVRDNTDEHRALQQEKFNATHDRLTGLYNQEYLYEQVKAMIAAHPEIRFSIAFVDVKNFKIINDIFGTAFGDFTIRRIGRWIAETMPENSVYGHLVGDTFGICLPTAQFDAEKVSQSLSPFTVSDGTVSHSVLVHLGVYEITEPELDVSVMFDRAHLALSTIEDEYQKHIAFYDGAMRERVLWNQYISGQLPEALAQGQIVPYLQPIVDGAGRAIGAEALVRWQHPTHGFLSPAAFIPVFEENGMIARVDRFMWQSACALLAEWRKKGLDLFLSVNISPKDFYFMDVAAEIRSVVKQYGIPPRSLRLEITETVMMTDVENRMRILDTLRQDGFIIEMDDFGSGYSSLNLLKEMPVDVMKIDMAFLSAAGVELKAQRILSNVVRMAEDIGMISLVEGVETKAQFRMLSEMGCRLFQGYYFARPMPVSEFEAQWLEGRAAEAAGDGEITGSPEANNRNLVAMAALLIDMPALIFSKDVQTGKYLACNQLFAEYAHRQSPADVVGLTDFDLYDQETAEAFLERDRTTLAMNKPYVFYEDVANAAGELRRMQTTKLRYLDVNQRECIMGMTVDVSSARTLT